MGYLSPNFFIGSIKIGTIENASCFNLGNNFPSHFLSHQKLNQGFGSINGDHNDIKDILSRLDDCDGIDMFNQIPNDEAELYLQPFIEDEEKVIEKNSE